MSKFLHFTTLKSHLSQATASLWRNKLRSFLTGLGIVIGIAAVIVVISAGQGVRGLILGQFESFGSNVISVEVKTPSLPKNSAEEGQARALGTVVTTLTLDDKAAIDKLPNIRATYGAQMGQAVVNSPAGVKKTIMLYGVSPEFFDIDSSRVAQGRQFTIEEDEGLARVAILGVGVARDLFGDDNPIGQLIKVKQKNFQVIGVMAPRGSITFFDMDTLVYIPVRTLQRQVLGMDHVTNIISQYSDDTRRYVTVAAIEDLLRQRHHIDIDNPDKDDFTVQTMDDAINILNTVVGGLTMVLVALATISLIVGGVGITNIMYVSVLERTFEIGLRKAVGATKKQITQQFLTEAVLLTGGGGVGGVVLGALLSYGVSVVATLQGFSWDFIIPLYAVVLGVGVSFVCGLVFGLYPARQAAELDPIEALRHE